MSDHDQEQGEYRLLAVTINAMGSADVVGFFQRCGGDVDFSGCDRWIEHEDDIPGPMKTPAGPQEPGGYVAYLVRRSCLTDAGNEYDADVYVQSVSERQEFFDNPAWTTDAPAYPALRQAMARQQSLDERLEGGEADGPAAARPGPRL